VVDNCLTTSGPIVSHAVPALTSIFGGSERKTTDDNMAREISNLAATQKDVIDLIGGVRIALETAKQDLANCTAQITEAVELAALDNARQGLDKYYDVINSAM
jgi:hypothetical protein